MIKSLRQIARIAPDLKGWKSKNKYVVIESDDWGCERIRDNEQLGNIPTEWKKFYNSPYYKFDSIARIDDLENLFSLLKSYKGMDGKPPVITANTIVGNPDYGKIKESGFNEFHYIDFRKTLKSFDEHLFETWEKGIELGVFKPQFHGRDHINVEAWLDVLRSGDEVYLDAFERGICSVDRSLNKSKRNLMAALLTNDINIQISKCESLRDGIRIFKDAFGYNSESFIAPSYTWFDLAEKELAKLGVKYLQGIRNQKKPNSQNDTNYIKHYLGEKNKYNQHYLIRNVFFEPSIYGEVNIIEDCMERMRWSFYFNRPVIISMHRLNIIGRLVPENHTRNLNFLDNFLKKMLKKWPDIEFVSSDELGNKINSI